VDTHPAVSPDGDSIAYVSDRSGTLQLWIMDLDSTDKRLVTDEEGSVLHPTWSEDAKEISYLIAKHPVEPMLTLKRYNLGDGSVEVLETGLKIPLPTVRDLPSPDSIPLKWQRFIPEGQLIIRAGRIFDGIGPGYLTNHEIVIQDNRITEIRPWSSNQPPQQVIDASQDTVFPGLIDLDVRQAFVGGERLGRTWLTFGVTTIREVVSEPLEAIERKESWQSGRRAGPRLFMGASLCPGVSGQVSMAETEAKIASAASNGMDFIQLCREMVGGIQQQLIGSAHMQGLAVSSETPFPAALLGVDEVSLSSASLNQDGAGLQVSAFAYGDVVDVVGQSGIAVVSRLAPISIADPVKRSDFFDADPYRTLFTAAERKWYEDFWHRQDLSSRIEMRTAMRAMSQSLTRTIARGGRVAAGSGAPITPYGLGLQAELQFLTETGLQPFQVLKMATLDAARILGVASELGSIRAGKLADLVIARGDPLADIGDAQQVLFTIVNGRAYTRQELLVPGATAVGNLYN
jgi:hypothetical protein